MWFSALKGPYLTLGQIDKTLPVDVSVEANKKIKRGIFVYVEGLTAGETPQSPRFSLYTSAVAGNANAVPYIALMGVEDYQAGMAGNIGQAETVGNKKTTLAGDERKFLDPHQVLNEQDGQDFRGPRITAISCIQAGEYQTNAFDREKENLFYVGCPLTVNDEGMLTPYVAGKNIVGYCSEAPKVRWINDLGADDPTNRITGGNDTVIGFTTAWIPSASASPAPVPNCTVTFNSNGGSAVAAQSIDIGSKATEPDPAPTKTGFTFGGWFKDVGLTEEFAFNTETVKGDITLYAKWTATDTVTGQAAKGAQTQDPKAAANAAGAQANKGGAPAGQSK